MANPGAPSNTLHCQCGGTREKSWHLVCPTCWAKVPVLLQNEVYEAYREKQGSARHYTAIREVMKLLRSLRPGAKQ